MNSKGFAITTILYGTLILFLMLLVSMLGILGAYKNRLSKLIDGNNGARCIINGNCVEVEKEEKGIIPVVISNDGTVTTISKSDTNWYNYEEKNGLMVFL